ncbi:MAG: DMT family transporter [bacterium]
MPRYVADLALLAAAAAWGLTFPLGKIVLSVLPPFTYLAARFTLAAVVLGMARPRAVTPRRDWLAAGAVGVVLFVAYALQTLGLRLTTASNAAFITGLSLVMVPLISAAWLRRAPNPHVLAGVVAATVGLGLLTIKDTPGVRLGDLLVLGCAVGFAFHIVLVGRLAPRLHPTTLTAAQLAPAAALSMLAAVAERPIDALAGAGLGVWGIVAFMALTATAGAFLIQAWAQRFTSASHVGLMFTFEPVAAAVAAHVLLGEALTGPQAGGAALILAGIAAAELKQDTADERREERR